MGVNITTLRNELLTDPRDIGYAALISPNRQDADLADAVNLVRPGGNYQINREPVQPKDIIKAIDPLDFAAISPTQSQALSLLFSTMVLDLSDSNTKTNLLANLPALGTTKSALTALAKRQGSRSEVLFGNGVSVTASDIAAALNAP